MADSGLTHVQLIMRADDADDALGHAASWAAATGRTIVDHRTYSLEPGYDLGKLAETESRLVAVPRVYVRTSCGETAREAGHIHPAYRVSLIVRSAE